MTRIYLADGNPEERAALRLVLEELNMQVIGEAADWQTTIDATLTSSNTLTPPLIKLISYLKGLY